MGFKAVDQTKFVTAISELTRNAILHGAGGVLHLYELRHGARRGLKAVVQDHGPGIADIDRAMQDGFSTGDGMGLGLGGACRLVNEFHIESSAEAGTCITVIRWRRP